MSRPIWGSSSSIAAMIWLLMLCGRECRGLGHGWDGEGRGIRGRGEDDGACLQGSDVICGGRSRKDDEAEIDEYHRGMVQIEYNLDGHATLQACFVFAPSSPSINRFSPNLAPRSKMHRLSPPWDDYISFTTPYSKTFQGSSRA